MCRVLCVSSGVCVVVMVVVVVVCVCVRGGVGDDADGGDGGGDWRWWIGAIAERCTVNPMDPESGAHLCWSTG